MRDPFRNDVKQQLVREAKIGLTLVAIVLAIFLYIVFHKITGRGRHFTDQARNAPIVEPVWTIDSKDADFARFPNTDSDNTVQQLTMKNAGSTPAIAARQTAHSQPAERGNFVSPSRIQPDPDKLTADHRNPITEISVSETKSIPPQKAKSASRIGDSISNLLGSFAAPDAKQTDPPTPLPSPSNKERPLPAANAISSPASDSKAIGSVAANTPSKTKPVPNSIESKSLVPNDLRAANNSVSPIVASLVDKKRGVQLTSAISDELESSSRSDFDPNQNETVTNKPQAPLHPGLPMPSEDEDGDDQSFPKLLRSVVGDKPSSNDFQPVAEHDDSLAHNLPINSTKSQPTSVLDKTDGSWPGESGKSFPPVLTESNLAATDFPKLHPAKPLPDVVSDQPKRLPGSIQKDIAKAHFPGSFVSSVAAQKQPTETPVLPPATHVVQEGDSYWSIAANIYNDGRFFRALYEHNRIVIPSFELVPGTKLATPLKSDLIKLFPDDCPPQEGVLKVEDQISTLDKESQIYITQRGDTLFEIAGQKLGQASRYLDIYDLNRPRLNANVNHLSPLPSGVRLVLPPQ